MADILTHIEAYKREEIAAAKRARSRGAVEAAAKAAPPPRGFLAAIEQRLAAGDYSLIPEVKKASPSKGLVPADFDPPAPGRAYGTRRPTSPPVRARHRGTARPDGAARPRGGERERHLRARGYCAAGGDRHFDLPGRREPDAAGRC